MVYVLLATAIFAVTGIETVSAQETANKPLTLQQCIALAQSKSEDCLSNAKYKPRRKKNTTGKRRPAT